MIARGADMTTMYTGTPGNDTDCTVITAEDVADLPGPARRYLAFMGVVGRPRDRSFQARFSGFFRMAPGRRWTPLEARQRNTVSPVGREFDMRVRVAHVLPMRGRDTYLGGRGRMHGTILGGLTVVEGTGRQFDLGELVTWVGDALMLAPSMLLPPIAEWSSVDDLSFEIRMTDGPNTVTGRVLVDEHGRLTDFRTTDRWYAGRGGPVRAEWRTPAAGWTTAGERPLPIEGVATWSLPTGPFTYARGHWVEGTVEYNGPPADDLHRGSRLRRSLAEGARGAVQVATALVTSPLLHGAHDRWGATLFEEKSSMPGDRLVPFPRLTSTRAITVDAPPEKVWPWLVQLGQGRGGFYSFEALENLVGCDMHGAVVIEPALQRLDVGDLIRLAPGGSPCYRVAQVEPPHVLVLAGADPRTKEVAPLPTSRNQMACTWQWLLQPLEDGSRTRLIARQRYSYPGNQWLLWHLVDPIDFVMERQMLRGIKARAEGPSVAEAGLVTSRWTRRSRACRGGRRRTLRVLSEESPFGPAAPLAAALRARGRGRRRDIRRGRDGLLAPVQAVETGL
jgi:hypothetical protein